MGRYIEMRRKRFSEYTTEELQKLVNEYPDVYPKAKKELERRKITVVPKEKVEVIG